MNSIGDDRREWTVLNTVQATLMASAVVIAFVLAYYLQAALFALFVGIVLSTVLKPLVERAERLGLKHGTAVVLIYFAATVLLATALAFVVPKLGEQVSGLWNDLPAFYEKARTKLLESSNGLIRQVAAHLPFRPDNGAAPPAVTSEALGQIGGLLGGAAWAVAVVLFSFYWSLQERRTLQALLLVVPAAHRESTRDLIDAMQAKVGAYVGGQSLLCLIIGLLTMTAYSIVGVEHAVALGLVAGLCEAVPTFGPTLGAIPAALVAATQGGSALVGVAVTLALVHLAENLFLYPRIMDRAVGVHPVVTLLALAAFTAVFGVPGAVLAIVMAAILQLLIERFFLSREALEPTPPPGRDSISILQHEAEELIRDVRLTLRSKPDTPTETSDRVEDSVEKLAGEIEQRLAAVPATNDSSASDDETRTPVQV